MDIYDEFNFEETFNLLGEFWLPNEDENKYMGNINFTPNMNIETTLYKKEKIKKTNNFKNNKIYLGEIYKNHFTHKINLYRNFLTFEHLESDNYLTKIFSKYLFINTYYEREEDIKFKSLSISFNILDKWLNLDKFLYYKEIESNKIAEYELDTNIKILIFFILKINYENKFEENYNYSQKNLKIIPYIKIETKNEENFLIFYEDKMNQLKEFLTLIIDIPVKFVDIFGESERSCSILKEKKIYTPIKILFLHNPYNKDYLKLIEPKISLKDWISFGKLSSNFGKLLNEWFIKYGNLKRIIDILFYEIYYNPNNFELSIMNLIFALEYYHRLNLNNEFKQFKEDEIIFKQRLDRISNNLSNEDKNWVFKNIEYSNETTFRERLKEIFIKFKDYFDLFIIKDKNFINEMYNLRNLFAHSDKSKFKQNKNLLKTEYLFELYKKLMLILKIILLNEIGLDKELIKDYIKFSLKYQININEL